MKSNTEANYKKKQRARNILLAEQAKARALRHELLRAAPAPVQVPADQGETISRIEKAKAKRAARAARGPGFAAQVPRVTMSIKGICWACRNRRAGNLDANSQLFTCDSCAKTAVPRMKIKQHGEYTAAMIYDANNPSSAREAETFDPETITKEDMAHRSARKCATPGQGNDS